MADYTEVLRIAPQAAWAYANRANLYDARDQLEQAIRDFTEAIRLAPGDPRLFNNRGRCLAQRGQFEEALADFDEAVRLARRPPTLVFQPSHHAIVWRTSREPLPTSRRCCMRQAPNSAVLNQPAAAHYAHGDPAAAIADHRQALQVDPDDVTACNSLAWLLATNPNDQIRDGPQALVYAGKACEVTR